MRTITLLYLLLGIGLCGTMGLHLMHVIGQPDPLVPSLARAAALPGSLLLQFLDQDQHGLALLICAGSILVNFLLLNWLADNISA